MARWRRWRGKTASRIWRLRWQPAGSGQQLHRIDRFLLQLIQHALPRRLVRTPAQDGGAVAETFAAEMIVADFDHQLGFQRTPLGRTFGGPAARAARRVAGESRRSDQSFEFCGQRGLLLALDRGGESDVMQQPCIVVEAEQQRTDDFPPVQSVGRVAKPADDAVGAAKILDLLHAVAIAGLVWQVDAFGDPAVKTAARLAEPFFRNGETGRCRREPKGGLRLELSPC